MSAARQPIKLRQQPTPGSTPGNAGARQARPLARCVAPADRNRMALFGTGIVFFSSSSPPSSATCSPRRIRSGRTSRVSRQTPNQRALVRHRRTGSRLFQPYPGWGADGAAGRHARHADPGGRARHALRADQRLRARHGSTPILMRMADVLLAFPTFLLAAFLNATLRPPMANRPGKAGPMTPASRRSWTKEAHPRFLPDLRRAGDRQSWSGYARLIRSQVLSLREREFVEAARSIGAPSRTILFRHILPNSITPIIVAVSVNFGNAILAESALSYLGVGIQPPTPSWGQMIIANPRSVAVLPAPDHRARRRAGAVDPGVQLLWRRGRRRAESSANSRRN